MRRPFTNLVLSVLAMLTLSACGILSADQTPDYRYRLTVEVDTPDGVRSGSSVIEVKQTLVRAGSAPSKQAVQRRVNGEAVAIEIPGGQTLFALLRSDNDPDWASRIYVLLEKQKDQDLVQSLDDVLELKGVRALPRMWPPTAIHDARSAYPLMVAFEDLGDPTSMVLVDPDNLASTFGESVVLKRITVELTDSAVITGIDQRLTWLGRSFRGYPRESFPTGLPVGDIKSLFQRGDL